MSRSRKRQPYTVGAGCRSQKRGKQVCNRKFRRQERRAILSGRWDRLPYRQIEVMDPWDLGGDGKYYCHGDEHDEWFVRLMRK